MGDWADTFPPTHNALCHCLVVPLTAHPHILPHMPYPAAQQRPSGRGAAAGGYGNLFWSHEEGVSPLSLLVLSPSSRDGVMFL